MTLGASLSPYEVATNDKHVCCQSLRELAMHRFLYGPIDLLQLAFAMSTLLAWTLFIIPCSAMHPPNYQGCIDAKAKALPYCDTTKSHEDRANDLLSRLTLEEKIAMISPQPRLGNLCATHTAGCARLGLPDWMWLVETNTAVAAKCLGPGRCTTTFNGPMGMGASFNRSSWYLKGSVLGSEMRAIANANGRRGDLGDGFVGLTGFGPNINVARDPRFGRLSELPGEDPFHSGTYAKEMVRGMQEPDAKGYPKMLAYVKHFTAYSLEYNRCDRVPFSWGPAGGRAMQIEHVMCHTCESGPGRG